MCSFFQGQINTEQKCGTLHDFECHPCAGAMVILGVPILVYVLPKQWYAATTKSSINLKLVYP